MAYNAKSGNDVKEKRFIGFPQTRKSAMVYLRRNQSKRSLWLMEKGIVIVYEATWKRE